MKVFLASPALVGASMMLGFMPAIASAQDFAGNDRALAGRFSISTSYAPKRDLDFSESRISYHFAAGFSLGIAYKWESRRIRPVSSVQFVDETAWHPGLAYRSGERSIATGEIRDTLSVQKSFGAFSTHMGVSTNAGFGQSRPVAGGSYNFRNGFRMGFQVDGRNTVSYAVYAQRGPILGTYLINWRHPAYLFGWLF